MQADRLYTILVRLWLLLCGLLGMTSYYYSSKRRRLVRSMWLGIYSGLMILYSLGGFYFYFNYGRKYFTPLHFRHYELLHTLCITNMCLHFLLTVNQVRLRLSQERRLCELFNQLMGLRWHWGLESSISATCKVILLIKAFTYVHQITSPLVGVLIVVEHRQLTLMDIFCNFYFIYIFSNMHSYMLAYLLMLLKLAEITQMSVNQEDVDLWTKLRRHKKLSQIARQVHEIFAQEILIVLLSHLFFNTCTFYLAYSLTRNGDIWNAKVQLTIFSFLIKLVDVLLIEFACEHLLAKEHRLIEQIKATDHQSKWRECEMAQLMEVIHFSKGTPKNVLGMFSLDKRCAFHIISSSLSYAIIIIQVGYIHLQNKQQFHLM